MHCQRDSVQPWYKSCAAGNFSVWLRACFSIALAATRSSHLLNSIDAVTSSLAVLGRSYSQLVPLLPGPVRPCPRTTSLLAPPVPQPLSTLASFRPPAAHLLQNHLHPAPPQPSPSCGTLRDAPRLLTGRCRKTSPRSEPTVPVPSRSQHSLRACGLPGAGRRPGRQGPPTSICVSFSTTKAIPSSCTAPPAALRMPTSRHPFWLLCASAG